MGIDPEVRARVNARPRAALCHLPTPLEALRTPLEGVAGRLFVKRDDCTGLAFGGNKSRKLEFSLGDALATGATAVITASSVQSNHLRQTAAGAARHGLDCHLVVSPALERFPRDHLDSGNVLLDQLLGARLHLAPSAADEGATIERVRRAIECDGGRPYVIPLGASDGIGCVGYVVAAWELLEQCQRGGFVPSHVFVATGSGGTHAGLLAGLRLAGVDTVVVGVSVSEPAPAKRAKVKTALADLERVLGLSLPIADEHLLVYDDYTGPGYGHPTRDANACIVRIARHEGLLLDPDYTGKAFAGMADLLARRAVGVVRDAVFLHTGGAPVIFADPRMLVSVARDAPELVPLYARVHDHPVTD